MLKKDVSVTSVYWRQWGTFLGRLWDVPPSAINVKNCNGFNILAKTEHCWISKRRKNWNLHTTDLFTRRRDIASCPLTKQKHLGKCSNEKLRTSTLANDGTIRSIADFASTVSNVKMLKYLIVSCNNVVFSLCSHSKIICGGGVHF